MDENEDEHAKEETEYFKSYAELSIQRTMLLDKVRVEAYKDAIFSRSELFNGKVVLDVGAGTGILSVLCAMAGAKKVYAIEASQGLIDVLNAVVHDNGYDGTIEVVADEVEKIDLKDKVDVIISEWMGHYLLHEGMLDSVINSRRFLKDDGIMVPHTATIYAVLCDVPSVASEWSYVCDVNLCAASAIFRSQAALHPCIEQLNDENLLSESKVLASFNINSVTTDDLQEITKQLVFTCDKNGTLEGICLWFDVDLIDNIKLSTSPEDEDTHWKQTIILFPGPVKVNEGDQVAVELTLTKASTRLYMISMEMLDPKTVTSSVAIECSNTDETKQKDDDNSMSEEMTEERSDE